MHSNHSALTQWRHHEYKRLYNPITTIDNCKELKVDIFHWSSHRSNTIKLLEQCHSFQSRSIIMFEPLGHQAPYRATTRQFHLMALFVWVNSYGKILIKIKDLRTWKHFYFYLIYRQVLWKFNYMTNYFLRHLTTTRRLWFYSNSLDWSLI